MSHFYVCTALCGGDCYMPCLSFLLEMPLISAHPNRQRQHDVLCVQDELPERLLGTVRLNNLDLSYGADLNLQTGVITRKAGAQ